MFAGTRDEMLADPQSLTGRYLRGELRIPVPAAPPQAAGKIPAASTARAATICKNVDLMIPLGMLVAVTGVSGSGKSTLVYDVLYKALQARRTGGNWREFCDRIEGDAVLNGVEMVDQSPIGRTPRSNPATYMKAFDPIREVFASTPEAKKRGLAPGHFSFNIPGGRCEACQGDGTVTVEMRFLADVELVCEECRGTRYKSSVLDVRYKEKNIHDVLQMTVREALTFFAAVPESHLAPARARRSRPRLPAARPIRHHPLRRRGATLETCRASYPPGEQRGPVYLRRAHHRPAFRRYPEAPDRVP